MHAQRLTAAGSTLSAAALLMLLGSAGPAQALSCAPGLVPAIVDGVQACVPAPSGQPEPSPFYNPGESNYDPVTGHYSEAVPAVPVPAESPTVPAAAPSAEPARTEEAAPGGTAVLPAPAATSSPSPSPSTSRTPRPTPSAAAAEERAGMETVLPAAAAVVILGVLAGALLRRHRNRRG